MPMNRPRASIPNLNGTSVESLMDQQRLVAEAARALGAALLTAWPHGRDYQTIADPNDKTFNRDVANVGEQLRAVNQIMESASHESIRLLPTRRPN